MNGFYSADELRALGFAALGKNVNISRRASLYGIGRIHLANNIRIDDFCILSAGEEGIHLGNYVHIAAHSLMVGRCRIEMGDYSGLSSRCSVYSSSDDYSGEWMTNPTVPERFTGVKHAPVVIGRHAIIGSGSVLLPGVTVHEGVAVGALALVTKDCEAFGVYIGAPARRKSERSRQLLELEARMNLEDSHE